MNVRFDRGVVRCCDGLYLQSLLFNYQFKGHRVQKDDCFSSEGIN